MADAKKRLQAIKTELNKDDNTMVVTFLKNDDWKKNDKFQHRFVSINADGATEKDAQDAPTVSEEKKDENETGNLTFTLTGKEFDQSNISLADKAKWLLQVKPKEAKGDEKYDWTTELNMYYMARIDIDLFEANVPLIAESDTPEYKIVEPVLVKYENVRKSYSNLPDKWPNGDPIQSSVVLHELDYHKDKKTFNFAIEAQIGWEIVGGVKVKSAGFELRMRDTTPAEYKEQKAIQEEKRKARIAAEKTKLLALTAPKATNDPAPAPEEEPVVVENNG